MYLKAHLTEEDRLALAASQARVKKQKNQWFVML